MIGDIKVGSIAISKLKDLDTYQAIISTNSTKITLTSPDRAWLIKQSGKQLMELLK